MARFTLALASLALFVVATSAQSVPTAESIPAACSSQCAITLETSILCTGQYPDATDTAACFCSALPSDLSSCADCISSAGQSDLSQSLAAASASCSTASQACAFSCNITPCGATDVACQCSASYLQSIYNCGACNTANGNTGQTQLSDYQALADSCAAQSYTNTPTGSGALPSPTGQDTYVAPVLTATGATDTTAAAETSAAAETTAAAGTTTTGAAGGVVTAPATLSKAASASASKLASSVKASGSSKSAAASATVGSAATGGAGQKMSVGWAGVLGAVLVGLMA